MTTRRERLIDARRARRISQRELADEIGTTQVTVARLELGQHEPTLRVALRLAGALDATVEDLFGAAEPAQDSPRAVGVAGGTTHRTGRSREHDEP